ncbi:MAG: MFS transporter [Acidimicrobiales bacterium]
MNLLVPWLGAARRRGLDRQHVVLLLLLGATSFFDGYDSGIKALALSHIRETFELTKAEAAALLAVVFLGALPAMLITRLADRVGRRRLLIYSVIGYTAFSGLTALAPNAAAFGGLQFAQQLFLVAEAAIVWTMAAEELPAGARGFGFGVLAMNNALGVGFGAILWGGFLEPSGASWRWLYVVALPPMLLVAVLRRRLPESRRFLTAQERGALARRWHEILRPGVRRWLVLVVVTTFLTQLVAQAVTFTIDFLETDRGLSTTAANFMLVFAGLPGIPIMVVAGGLSDRFGRRAVGCGFATASALGALGFFWLPGGIPVLLPCMSLTLIGQLGAAPVLQTYTSELFPTALRSSAAAWANVAAVLGRSGSLAMAAPLLAVFSQSTTATLLLIGPVVAVIIYLVAFPDTHGRELEETSGDTIGITVATAPI